LLAIDLPLVAMGQIGVQVIVSEDDGESRLRAVGGVHWNA
jgi:hypothetical protein